MKECYLCRGETKYSCVICQATLCNVCADPADVSETGYDEAVYCVGICPDRRCPENVTSRKPTLCQGNENVHPFFKAIARKRKSEANTPVVKKTARRDANNVRCD